MNIIPYLFTVVILIAWNAYSLYTTDKLKKEITSLEQENYRLQEELNFIYSVNNEQEIL